MFAGFGEEEESLISIWIWAKENDELCFAFVCIFKRGGMPWYGWTNIIPSQNNQSELFSTDGYPVVEEPCIFELVMYFYVLYCLCYVN